jgi:hypothetical protein
MKFCKASLFLFLLVGVCLPAVSQTQIRANIPFSFFAAGKSLPAGHYLIVRAFDSDQIAWRISNQQGGMAVLLTNSVLSPRKAHQPSLVFHCTGTKYTLIQFWPQGHFGRDLPLREIVKTHMLAEADKDIVIEAE